MTYLITENNALAEEVIGKICEVLGRAHGTAQAANEPGEARAILHVAHAFAIEFAPTVEATLVYRRGLPTPPTGRQRRCRRRRSRP